MVRAGASGTVSVDRADLDPGFWLWGSMVWNSDEDYEGVTACAEPDPSGHFLYPNHDECDPPIILREVLLNPW